jgi:hypothetical protein
VLRRPAPYTAAMRNEMTMLSNMYRCKKYGAALVFQRWGCKAGFIAGLCLCDAAELYRRASTRWRLLGFGGAALRTT